MIVKKQKKHIPKSVFIILVPVLIIIFLTVKNLSSCPKGETFQGKKGNYTIIGEENYQSDQLKLKGCHLRLEEADLTTDYYLDRQAYRNLRGQKSSDVGNGCLVYKIKNSQEINEYCFGENVNVTQSLLQTTPKAVNLELKQFNFAGTKWRYNIQAGGGVGGIMTFERDDNGSLSGTFTEFGPEGEQVKTFIGSFEKNNFLLTLEDYPTFEVVLSADSNTLAGKPVEPEKDIYYPDDFFQAERQP